MRTLNVIMDPIANNYSIYKEEQNRRIKRHSAISRSTNIFCATVLHRLPCCTIVQRSIDTAVKQCAAPGFTISCREDSVVFILQKSRSSCRDGPKRNRVFCIKCSNAQYWCKLARSKCGFASEKN